MSLPGAGIMGGQYLDLHGCWDETWIPKLEWPTNLYVELLSQPPHL